MSEIMKTMKTKKELRITALQGSILKRLPDALVGVRAQTIRALVGREMMRGVWGGQFVRTAKGSEALGQHEMNGKRPRGFAAMDKGRQQRLASEGGKKAHVLGVAFKYKKGDPFAAECARKGADARRENIRRQVKIPFSAAEATS